MFIISNGILQSWPIAENRIITMHDVLAICLMWDECSCIWKSSSSSSSRSSSKSRCVLCNSNHGSSDSNGLSRTESINCERLFPVNSIKRLQLECQQTSRWQIFVGKKCRGRFFEFPQFEKKLSHHEKSGSSKWSESCNELGGLGLNF